MSSHAESEKEFKCLPRKGINDWEHPLSLALGSWSEKRWEEENMIVYHRRHTQ